MKVTNLEVVILFLLYCNGIVCACPDQCKCVDNITRCKRLDLPGTIPDNTEQFYTEEFDLNTLDSESFNETKWRNLTVLDISAAIGQHLRNRAFAGLSNLEHLGVHSPELRYIGPSVFEGLDKVRTLDFSYNKNLDFFDFSQAMDISTREILPSLINLTIAEMNSLQVGILDLDDSMLSSLFLRRRLEYIDVSGVNIGLLESVTFERLLCNSLIHIKASKTALGFPMNFWKTGVCSSLRIFDITDAQFQFVKQGPTEIECNPLSFFSNVEILLGSATLSGTVEINSYNFDFRNCHYHLKKIELRQNNLKWLNMTVKIHETLQESISDIDISDNILEFIAPDLIYPSKNLEILRLSNNKLSVMQLNYQGQFGTLLSRSKHLRKIYLANNSLEGIPKLYFTSNEKLEYIDLSGNKLTSCDFDLQRVIKLKYLDLHNNLIHFVGEKIRMGLNSLNAQYSQAPAPTNLSISSKITTPSDNAQTDNARFDRFHVNLGFNPFQCSCHKESMQVVEWLQTAVCVYRADVTYTCTFDGKTLNILDSASTKVKAECTHKKLLGILQIVMPIVIGCIVLVCVFIVLFSRRLKRIKQYQDFLQDLKDDTFAKTFLVFLSFCSEDTEFVLNNVYNPLQNTFAEVTGNDRTYVCIGDREFNLGLRVHEEVMRCMEESSVVIFVVSNTFCKKSWCKMEVGEAYDQRKPMIMFLKERVEVSDMPKVLRRIFNRYTHAAWINDDNGGHCEPNIQIICESIIKLARKNAHDADAV